MQAEEKQTRGRAKRESQRQGGRGRGKMEREGHLHSSEKAEQWSAMECERSKKIREPEGKGGKITMSETQRSVDEGVPRGSGSLAEIV